MSWQMEYKKAMSQAAYKRGTPVAFDGGSYYGWLADDWRELCKHLEHCKPVLGDLTEVEWDEFQGTFYEGDTRQHGVEIKVSCSCDQIQVRPWRWNGTVVEMLAGLLKEEDSDEES